MEKKYYGMWETVSPWLMAFARKNPECLAVIVDFVFLTMRENTAKLTNITKLYGKSKHNIPSFNMGFLSELIQVQT